MGKKKLKRGVGVPTICGNDSRTISMKMDLEYPVVFTNYIQSLSTWNIKGISCF